MYISPAWGDALLKPIVTKFGNSLYLTEVLNRSKCGVDWFGSFSSGEVQHLHFAKGTSGPYHSSATAFARDQEYENVDEFEIRHVELSLHDQEVTRTDELFVITVSKIINTNAEVTSDKELMRS